MPQFLIDLSAFQLALVFSLGFLAATWIGIFLCRRKVRKWIHGRRNANDMIGFALASFSTLYGILLALIAVEAYQDFAAVKDVLSREALTIATLRHDFEGFPQTFRSVMKIRLQSYAQEAVDVVRNNAGRDAQTAHAASPRLKALFEGVLSFKPSTKGEEIAQEESLRRLNTLVEQRRYLIAAGDDGIPAAVWWVVALGAVLLLLLTCLFDMEIHVHLILGGALALFLGAAVFLIAALDNPFSGGVTVSPAPIETVLELVLKAS